MAMMGSRTETRASRNAPSDGVSPPNIKAQLSSTRWAPPLSALMQSSTEAVQISNWIALPVAMDDFEALKFIMFGQTLRMDHLTNSENVQPQQRRQIPTIS